MVVLLLKINYSKTGWGNVAGEDVAGLKTDFKLSNEAFIHDVLFLTHFSRRIDYL